MNKWRDGELRLFRYRRSLVILSFTSSILFVVSFGYAFFRKLPGMAGTPGAGQVASATTGKRIIEETEWLRILPI